METGLVTIEIGFNEASSALYDARLTFDPSITETRATPEGALGKLLWYQRAKIFGNAKDLCITGPSGGKVDIEELASYNLGMLAMMCPKLFNLQITKLYEER